MDKMQLFCTHIRAALACYEDMPPEGQARARLFVTRKAGDIRQLKAAADAPGGELAADLLQKLQQPCNLNNIAHILRVVRVKRAYLVKSQHKFQRFSANAKFFAHF